VADNIKAKLSSEIMEQSVKTILSEIGEDVTREGLLDTPKRVAKMYRELFAGLYSDPAVHLERIFTEDSDDMVIISDIPFFSACEHHLVPFFGTAHIGYIPGPVVAERFHEGPYRIAGLSKFARVVDGFAKRPQVQEKLTRQIADCIDKALDPQGVIVVVTAEHMCMSMRGVQKVGAKTTTSAVRGLFATNADGIKDEFLTLLSLRK
jgi:GTP cyclohydrolase I